MTQPRTSGNYSGRLAVVTGAASGMGRELVLQLVQRGSSVAACDLDPRGLEQTTALATQSARDGVRLSSHVHDVADRDAVECFRDAAVEAHETDHIDMLFNNAGIHGGDSFVHGDRANWERVFSVCWNAVYLPTRAFLPLLAASRDAWLINTGSLNSFFATHGAGAPCTAYSAAKYAVRGFSEGLIEDLRTHAPSVRVAVVLPGTVVSGLGTNSDRILGRADEPSAVGDSRGLAGYLESLGIASDGLTSEDLSRIGEAIRAAFMVPAAEAARQILDAVAQGRWRILIGEDAHDVDQSVRANPDLAYEPGRVSQVNVDLLAGLVSLVAHTDPQRSAGLDHDVDLHVGRYLLTCRVIGGLVTVARKSGGAAGATVLTTDPATFRRLLSQAVSLDQAIDEGRARFTGSRVRIDGLVGRVRRMPAGTYAR